MSNGTNNDIIIIKLAITFPLIHAQLQCLDQSAPTKDSSGQATV
uniref:Uncharacterized protein n=1 Tax=Arundo donax TaxID=35708 RepID=A0A0A9G9E1_ARUDO